MSAPIVAIGIASIFVAAIGLHILIRRKRDEAEDREPPIPEFRPIQSEAKVARRLNASNIKWEL